MPKIFLAARSRQDISPATDAVAADIPITNEYAETQFDLLEDLVKRDSQRIRQYDMYHRMPAMRAAHYDVMPQGLGLDTTLEYCQRNRARVERVEGIAQLPKGELTYVFDEVLRTVRYQGVAAPLQACYFAHPIRSGFGLPPPHESLWWESFEVMTKDGVEEVESFGLAARGAAGFLSTGK